jgi:glycosyltransferase involved in cell wall biosynthesis
MKVCLVGNLPEPYGGVASYVYNLSVALLDLKTEIAIFDTRKHSHKKIPFSLSDYYCSNPDKLYGAVRLFQYLLGSLFSLERINLMRRFFKEFLLFPYLGKRLLRVLLLSFEIYFFVKKQGTVHLIHSQHAGYRSLSALVVGKTLNIPVVVTVFTSEFTMPKHELWRPVAIRVCNEASQVICISNHARRLVLEHCTNVDPEVIYCGVNSQEFNANYDVNLIREKYGLKDEKVVLYVGWFIERKGPLVLLKALSKAKRKDFKAFFIGPDHGFQEQMESFVSCNGLSDVIVLLGKVSEEDLHSFYALADVFVFPTITQDEGFGIVAAEAMASETPVVGSRIAAIPEVVLDGVTGFLFAPDDDEDLLTKLEILFDDDELRYKLGQQARQDVLARFSWDITAERTLKVYNAM